MQKVMLIIHVVPTQMWVTVFLIYGLCAQDLTYPAQTNMCVRSPLVQEALDQEIRANKVKSVNLILLFRYETCWIFQIEDLLSFHVVFCLKTRWWISGPLKLAVLWPVACHANNPLPCSSKAVVSLQYLNIFSNESSYYQRVASWHL